MFRGKISFAGNPNGAYHLELSYQGRNNEGQQVFVLHTKALTPSDVESIEAAIDFDFYIFDFWVDEVRLILEGEPDALFMVEHLGR